MWAGFTWAKVGYLWDGMVGLPAGRGVAAIPGVPGWDIWRWIATIWMLAVAVVALPVLWRHRDDPRSRAVSAIFGVTFVAGEVFNLYAQPQDPQMQINVMAWLTVGLGGGAGRGARRAARPPRVGGAGWPHGGAVRLQCLEHRAPARARQRLGSAIQRWNARPIPAAPSC